jgi:hypothetical protein
MADVDFFNVCAEKKMGAGWCWRQSEAVGGAFVLTGAKPIGVFSRGPRKGKPKFPDKKAYEKVVITTDELNAAYAEYEASTRNCYRCQGKGLENYGWSAEEGQKYRACKRCNGTGKAVSHG